MKIFTFILLSLFIFVSCDDFEPLPRHVVRKPIVITSNSDSTIIYCNRAINTMDRFIVLVNKLNGQLDNLNSKLDSLR